MKTYYQITLGNYFKGIETVQVESETACTVTINGRIQNKISSRFCYYSDLKTAKETQIIHFRKMIQSAKYDIQKAEKSIDRFIKHIRDAENYQI